MTVTRIENSVDAARHKTCIKRRNLSARVRNKVIIPWRAIKGSEDEREVGLLKIINNTVSVRQSFENIVADACHVIHQLFHAFLPVSASPRLPFKAYPGLLFSPLSLSLSLIFYISRYILFPSFFSTPPSTALPPPFLIHRAKQREEQKQRERERERERGREEEKEIKKKVRQDMIETERGIVTGSVSSLCLSKRWIYIYMYKAVPFEAEIN